MCMRLKLILIIIGTWLVWGMPLKAQESPSSAVSEAPSAHKQKHLPAKDDIQAVGSRNIGGRGLLNWYSTEKEIAMGHDYSQVVEAHAKLVTDSVVTEYVNRVGQNVVRNSDANVPFTIKVIDSDEINAFSLPGGFLYVNTALITAAQGEAELAGVMAHEIAHVAAHHASRQMTHFELLNLATIPLIFVGGGVGVAIKEGIGLAMPLTLTKFSRGFEREADYLGVEYLYQAGYDPQAFISFFERMQTVEKQKPTLISKMFSSHPQTADRIHKTQAEIARILPPREAYVISTSEFDVVKSRLAGVETRRLTREQDSGRPTLRRRPSAESGNSDGDGERPTLKRHSD
jgi:predicted Zn-dependent protease